ncbi:hypothetical protein Mgra_00002078 [Meloidogyne graminicola]|uniref:Uncharacterized protein n=1 Tax=Meloidogyne graminicola TaxID=189291 RepID=A0A8S9ZZG1_9BILA|nr:hypothetical protein Mgra_00002078 [Meloidogyne graminicola]
MLIIKIKKKKNNNNNNNIITIIPQEYWQILLQSLLQLSNNVQKINENIKNLNISNNNYSKRSIEAWTLFCIFIVSKIRFGFVIECFLRFNFKNKMENNQKEVFKNNTEQIIYEYKIKSNSNENIVLNCK